MDVSEDFMKVKLTGDFRLYNPPFPRLSVGCDRGGEASEKKSVSILENSIPWVIIIVRLS
jgi:hypothetical protein